LACKLLIKILNKEGPEEEPCGIPDSVGKGEEGFPKVLTLEPINITIKESKISEFV
jgi:hypothetical protein